MESCLRWLFIERARFMRGDPVSSNGENRRIASASPITLSPWINEPYPSLTELLSAHDVARLTRRPWWLIMGLSLIGRFPKRARFRGRPLGWLRANVLEWMARDRALKPVSHTSPRSCPRPCPKQACLLLTRTPSPASTNTRCKRSPPQQRRSRGHTRQNQP